MLKCKICSSGPCSTYQISEERPVVSKLKGEGKIEETFQSETFVHHCLCEK